MLEGQGEGRGTVGTTRRRAGHASPGGTPQAYLSCRSKAAVRHGRSNSAWSISTAVLASTSDGRNATNSEVRGGLFQARNCRDKQGSSDGNQEAVRGSRSPVVGPAAGSPQGTTKQARTLSLLPPTCCHRAGLSALVPSPFHTSL